MDTWSSLFSFLKPQASLSDEQKGCGIVLCTGGYLSQYFLNKNKTNFVRKSLYTCQQYYLQEGTGNMLAANKWMLEIKVGYANGSKIAENFRLIPIDAILAIMQKEEALRLPVQGRHT